MWLKKELLILIVVLPAAVSLFATDSAAQSTWQPTNNGLAPDFSCSPARRSALGACQESPPNGAKDQQANNKVSPSQQPGSVSDPNAMHAAQALTSVATPGSKAYLIGPLDVLDISVFQAPELSQTVEVADNGNIQLPLLGETPAAGKTAQQLQKDLNSRFGAKYLQNPQCTVIVKEFNSSRVTVSGAVKTPGVFPYKGETLYQFVTMAGGLSDTANSTVLVLRQSNGKGSAAKFNVADIAAGRAPDPPMQSGDVIVADSSSMKTGLNNLLKVLPLAGFAALATI
jgi:polysaccharide export outer membrane protein